MPQNRQPKTRQWFSLIMAVLLTGCRPEVAPQAQRQGFVGIVGVGQDDPLWPVFRGSAMRVHRDLGLSKIPFRAEAPESSSPNAQRQLLRRLRQEGMTALCVQVLEPEALAGTLNSLATQGVTIVTMWRPVESQVPFAHCGTHDEDIGAALADALHEAMQGKGTVAVLHADSVDRVSVKRHRAFMDRVARYRSCHVIHEFDCKANAELARTLIRDTMRRYPRLGGWAVMDNWPLRDLDENEALVPPTCRMVAVDPFPTVWQAFDHGTVSAMIASRYDLIAERAAKTCIASMLGSTEVPEPFSAPVRTVRAGQIGAFRQEWQRWARAGDEEK